MPALRETGFNRVSFGVQDFDPGVQRAINRVQSEEATRALMEAACSFLRTPSALGPSSSTAARSARGVTLKSHAPPLHFQLVVYVDASTVLRLALFDVG